LENVKKVVAKFEERINAEVRQQEKLDIVKKKDYKRKKLLEKFITKMLYG